MSVFISLGIVLLVMLIQFFLQFNTGVFALFRHYASGKMSRKRVHDLDGYFMMGVELAATILFILVVVLVTILNKTGIFENPVFNWFAVVLTVALGLACYFVYYRKGTGTELFVPRGFAKALRKQAMSIKKSSDAFMLGMSSLAGDFIFAFPLYFIIAIELCKMEGYIFIQPIVAVLFIASIALPVLIMRFRFHSFRNLADIERSRVKNKNFVRTILAVLYCLVALIILSFRILG